MEIKEPNYFQQSLQRCSTEMKDMSLTSWALLCSKLCLALLTCHLCFRRIWWIMKTASFTVQGTKAIFHWHLYALAAAKEKCMKKLRWLFSSQVISAGEKKKPKNITNILWEQVHTHRQWYACRCPCTQAHFSARCLWQSRFFCNKDAQEGRKTQRRVACQQGLMAEAVRHLSI